MRVRFHINFDKEYKKLQKKEQEKAKERMNLFMENPYNPVLKNHPLKGKYLNYRSINIIPKGARQDSAKWYTSYCSILVTFCSKFQQYWLRNFLTYSNYKGLLKCTPCQDHFFVKLSYTLTHRFTSKFS